MLTTIEIDDLIRRIVERFQPQKVMIFGSYAKGIATVKSDLDILVIKETVFPRARRTESIIPILSAKLIPVDVHVYTPEEVEEYGKEPLSFVNSILKTGKTVYEK